MSTSARTAGCFSAALSQREPLDSIACCSCRDGSICLDIIQDQWSPIHSISTILTSIQSLLCDPNVASPANPEAASLYTANRVDYNRRVRRVAQRSVEC